MILIQDSSSTGYSFKKISSFGAHDNALQRLDSNVLGNRKENKNNYPIPKGDTPYSKAKKAEYIEKDLKTAEKYYKLAIETGDRAESAVKDLAGVMHQQGKTIEAIEFLKQHRSIFIQEPLKYENLLINLRRQIVQKGNRLNKYLKISNFSLNTQKHLVASLFYKPERILGIDMVQENNFLYAIVKFSSHSAARKTLESFVHFDRFKVEWFSVSGDVAGDVLAMKTEHKKDKPIFAYKIFSRDLENKVFVMPLTQSDAEDLYQVTDLEAVQLLGSSFLEDL
jgi:hypothetical protein